MRSELRRVSVYLLAGCLILVGMPRRVYAANTVSGMAYGVNATVGLSILGVINTTIPLVTIPMSTIPMPSGGSDSDILPTVTLGTPEVVVVPGLLTLQSLSVLSTGLIQTSASGTVSPSASVASSTSTVSGLNILGGLITATTLQAKSTSSSNGFTGSSSSSAGTTISNLAIQSVNGGMPTSILPAANTEYTLTNVPVTLPQLLNATVSGTVYVNEQITSGNGTTSSGLTVNLLRVELTVSAGLPIVGNVVSIPLNATIASAQSETNFDGPPTRADVMSMAAAKQDDGVLISWRTDYEERNLGFNIYREDGTGKQRINPGLIAGSALTAGNTPLTAGQPYAWLDSERRRPDGARYWLEELDLDGNSVWHGPITVPATESTRSREGPSLRSPISPLLANLGARSSQTISAGEIEPRSVTLPPPDRRGFDLAARPAIKIGVNNAGWYRVTQEELLAAGLKPGIDPRRLQLYVDGRETPMRVRGEEDGSFDAGDAIEFYGVGLDTPSTATRVYWLAAGNSPGTRIPRIEGGTGLPSANSFRAVVERRDRVVYFPSLFNGDEENFFGPVIFNLPLVQELTLDHVVTDAPVEAHLEVSLQGATNVPHRVKVKLNATDLGEIVFDGFERATKNFSFAHALLTEGENRVTLERAGGASDGSLIVYLRLSYEHAFRATNDQLRLVASGGGAVRIGGFSSADLRLYDVTNADAPVELAASAEREGDAYALSANVAGEGERKLLALGGDRALHAASIEENRPSNWRRQIWKANLIVLSHRAFLPALTPLLEQRKMQGYRTALVDITDVYDEYSFGHKSPAAIKEMLRSAIRPPAAESRYVLLVGDASLDPRNYLGVGEFDFIPTKLLAVGDIETASDDWFADFDEDGAPEMAIGRMPARTLSDAVTMVAKTIRYEQATEGSRVALIADVGDVFDFERAAEQVRASIPAGTEVETIYRSKLSAGEARDAVIASLNRGPRLVNYFGHGARDLWRGNLLTVADAARLENRASPSVIVSLSCLNGLFQDTTIESLAESLLKSAGGAAVVWASSGLTGAGGQAGMNQEFMRLVQSGEARTFGEAAARAKRVIADRDVRRSWIYFGDPSLPAR